jgi:hypothetical protein
VLAGYGAFPQLAPCTSEWEYRAEYEDFEVFEYAPDDWDEWDDRLGSRENGFAVLIAALPVDPSYIGALGGRMKPDTAVRLRDAYTNLVRPKGNK